MSSRKPPVRAAQDDGGVGASERVLKQITELYETGLGGGQAGSLGLQAVSESSVVDFPLRKPRKKINVMIIGNHSAGKSSFINWYVGESIQKTGVAIETRGFTFVTSGRRRETLTGEATLRYFPYLEGFGSFTGILPNLSTEISTSKERNFPCVDFIDTPGLVDGDMQYPFDVEETILWMAQHADLIFVFFDPIGQATCKRTMQVVERLNKTSHLEKIHYFMSKADAVEKEHDRQRVLIQITQNLATKIRNSHAFNLPTFYLPREDDVPLSIPNAIEDVCKAIDKAISLTTQNNLTMLREHCGKVTERISHRLAEDVEHKAQNRKRSVQGIASYSVSLLTVLALLALLAAQAVVRLCPGVLPNGVCHHPGVAALQHSRPQHSQAWLQQAGGLAGLALLFLGVGKLRWRVKPTFTKRDLRRLEEYRLYVKKIALQVDSLYDEYFKSIGHRDSR